MAFLKLKNKDKKARNKTKTKKSDSSIEHEEGLSDEQELEELPNHVLSSETKVDGIDS